VEFVDVETIIQWKNSFQNLLSSRLLSKNVKNKEYRTIILPIVLYECETGLSHKGKNID
jgi:hypothetical protein